MISSVTGWRKNLLKCCLSIFCHEYVMAMSFLYLLSHILTDIGYFCSQLYMKKNYIRNIFVGASFIFVLSSAIMNAGGPPGGFSNAPSENSCTNCHGGTIITSSNANLANIRLTSGFHGGGYLPDSTYTIELTFKQTGKVKFGFEITCLDKNNSPIGTLSATNSRVGKVTASINSQTRQYIEHTSAGTAQVATDSTRWVFTWKAPSTNVGKVSFHAAVMATNNNGNDDPGDIVYGKRFDISPSSFLPVAIASTLDSVTCTNYTVQLKSTSTGSPTSYNWKLFGGSPTGSTAQNPTVSYASPGTKLAILTVKNSYGSSEPDTFKINVTASPAAIITNGTVGSVCKGDSLLLNANTGTSITYLWLHNNKTSRTLYVKDTGNYKVKVTSTTTGCTATSAAFRLNWYNTPTISISKVSSNDTFCNGYNETLTATGSTIDSVYWYVDGVLSRRTKTLSTLFSGSTTVNITAVAKSATNCKSPSSNVVKLIVRPKIYPSVFSSSKTTSTINLNWKKTAGIISTTYALNKVNYNPTTSDSTLALTGLLPNTSYDITIRSKQSSPCLSSDTTIIIKTNACSNLSYSIDFATRACKGSIMKATVKNLYKSKYSISFNNNPYTSDTVYNFTAQKSDSLLINIIDSLSPTCPALIEKIGYQVDTLTDKDTGSVIKFTAKICDNSYLYSIKPGYTTYSFYKNNLLVNSGATSSFMFANLVNGDKLTAIGKINTCDKVFGPVTISLSSKPAAAYTFTRSWKTYTFNATDNALSEYKWFAGTSALGTGNPLVSDFTAFNNSNVSVKLISKNSAGCVDSSSQNLTIPNFSSITDVQNNGFKVYPNPFGDMISIESLSEQYEIQIVNSVGQIVFADQIKNGVETIHTSDWSNGMYYIIIRDANHQLSSFKFVKQ